MLLFDVSVKRMLGRPTGINVGVLLSVSMVVASAILLALQGSIDAKRVIAVVFASSSRVCASRQNRVTENVQISERHKDDGYRLCHR